MKILNKLVENSVIMIFLTLSILTTIQKVSPANQVADIGELHRKEGIRIIKHYEGFRQYPYKDNDGTIKIGYGFNANGKTSITKQEADKILENKVDEIATDIRETAEKNNILLDTQHIYALTSLSYNIGKAKVDKILADPSLITGEEIMKYVKAKVDGKYVILNGIPPRRWEERRLFNS